MVGHPDGGPLSVAAGPRVPVDERVARLSGEGEILGIDVTIAPGMSGGPAVDATGAVVGIVVAKEATADTALVVATPDLASLHQAPVGRGSCPQHA